ncbi:hypothetical protein D9M68_774570 [compost metagenome]
MKDRLQTKLRSLLASQLPGFKVECRYASKQMIEVFLWSPTTREGMRITGIPSRSLIGSGALDAVVEKLLFEILTATQAQSVQRPLPDELM